LLRVDRQEQRDPGAEPILDPSTFLQAASSLKREGAVLSSICACPDEEGEVALSYFFEVAGTLKALRTRTSNRSIDSLFSLFSNSDFLEREANKLYRIKFLGHPNLAALKNPGST
jgi:NADH:ubiquinone oxidoreductase subunit C